MNLSRFSSPPLPLSLITGFTSQMVVGRSRCTRAHVLYVVVLLAVLTLAPVGIAAGIERPLPSLNHKVVGAVGTDEQVRGPVVSSDVVPVVDFFGAFQVATEHSFDYEDVLIDVPALVRSGMSGRFLLNVFPGECYPALPCRALFSALPRSMLVVKPSGLASDIPSRRIRLPSDSGGLPATTLTNTRRIQQSRAPNVCADSSSNITHSGG